MAKIENKVNLIPRPTTLHCLPLSNPFFKQSSIFMSERQEGNYAWPIASLTPSLSQLNGKNRQGWPRTPCPSNISTALCFLTSKLSQVRQHLHLYPPDCPHRLILCLRNKGRQWGREGWALATGDPGSLGQQKKERHSFRTPLEFWGQDHPPLQTAQGISERP